MVKTVRQSFLELNFIAADHGLNLGGCLHPVLKSIRTERRVQLKDESTSGYVIRIPTQFIRTKHSSQYNKVHIDKTSTFQRSSFLLSSFSLFVQRVSHTFALQIINLRFVFSQCQNCEFGFLCPNQILGPSRMRANQKWR